MMKVEGLDLHDDDSDDDNDNSNKLLLFLFILMSFSSYCIRILSKTVIEN